MGIKFVGYDILQRLKLLRGTQSQKEFAGRFGMEPNTYAYIEKYGKKLSLNLLYLLAKVEGVNINWLLTGQGEAHEISITQSICEIPVVARVHAGDPTIIYDESPTEINLTGVFVEVSGDSMEPTFQNHDLLLVNREVQPDSIHHGAYGIFANGDEWTFKRFNPQKGIILLEPLNSIYPTIAIAPDALKIFGIVTALYRPLKGYYPERVKRAEGGPQCI
jgi:SOS-response transcriptional repressor LexA